MRILYKLLRLKIAHIENFASSSQLGGNDDGNHDTNILVTGCWIFEFNSKTRYLIIYLYKSKIVAYKILYKNVYTG